MQLTEQHVINKNDPCFAAIDAAAFASKNLSNLELSAYPFLPIREVVGHALSK